MSFVDTRALDQRRASCLPTKSLPGCLQTSSESLFCAAGRQEGWREGGHLSSRLIQCKLSLDKEEHENELKQILGETQSSHDIDEDELLIIGTSGLLVAGRGCARHEETLVAYLELKSIELFVSSFSERLLHLHDSLHTVHNAIANYERDPSSCGPDHVSNIMTELQDTSRATMRLGETLACLKDSVKNAGSLREPVDDGGKRLFAVLEISEIKEEITRRLDDLGHTMKGAKEELVRLWTLASAFCSLSFSPRLPLILSTRSVAINPKGGTTTAFCICPGRTADQTI